tara:strand:+ start:106 stop:618 length:513 start_codon:yes stop_codon:yes gene_type:complete
MGYTSYLQKYEVIRLNPTVETGEYANGDVIFTGLEIPNAVREDGGCSKLISAFVVAEGSNHPIGYLVFTEKTVTLGTVNATADVSHANLIAANPLGVVYTEDTIDTDDKIDNVTFGQFFGTGNGHEEFGLPILLQADAGSKSVYVGMIKDQEVVTFPQTDSLQVILHIEK